jgi:hypothetical protein
MGSCITTLSLSDQLYVTLKGKPDPHTLLVLQLHYDMYDPISKKQIDELTQIAISNDYNVELSSQLTPLPGV